MFAVSKREYFFYSLLVAQMFAALNSYVHLSWIQDSNNSTRIRPRLLYHVLYYGLTCVLRLRLHMKELGHSSTL